MIIWEGDPNDPSRKPPEMHQLIENFCLGTRRLEIFGRQHSLRRGWVTVTAESLELSPEQLKVWEREGNYAAGAVPFEREKWEKSIKESAQATSGKCVVPNTTEIENLRPKSPPPRGGSSTTTQTAVPGTGNPVSGGIHMSPAPAQPGPLMNAGLPRNPMQNQNFNNQNFGGQMMG